MLRAGYLMWLWDVARLHIELRTDCESPVCRVIHEVWEPRSTHEIGNDKFLICLGAGRGQYCRYTKSIPLGFLPL